MAATIDVVRHSDGKTYYARGASATPRTNPKRGIDAGNTLIWNGRTRVSTLIIPRQNPVDVDSWTPRSRSYSYSVPVTYEKPPFASSVQHSARNTVSEQKNGFLSAYLPAGTIHKLNRPLASAALPLVYRK